ncbi:hypothetical protein GQ55_3G118800 [Panicum hallii var. hallii]|uniref:Cathepsin propeptide inhibitor domain-containing protein n=1 Tax=Panicum hallii var. hallii TaxID=1504633 RepID=A0A2T7E8H4_9POAL|nr:hypothetical protein GQ55_3G118800 [Panicum hallii var. hallii]
MPLYKQEVSVKEVMSDREAVRQEDAEVDEATMKARFQDWMVEYGRSYRTEKEKARRYEVFKETAIHADKANASKRAGARVAAPNGLADWTDEECECLEFHNFDWEIYIDHINNMAAHGWFIGREDVKQVYVPNYLHKYCCCFNKNAHCQPENLILFWMLTIRLCSSHDCT